jgi:hypothetical protein
MKKGQIGLIILGILILALFVFIIIVITNKDKETPDTPFSIKNNMSTINLKTRTQTINCTQGIYPDYDCTPGAIFPSATKEVICTTGYTIKVRNVSEKLKTEVYKSYDIITRKPLEYEIDHVIALELGGSNDISNLYPEKYNMTLGAREKDKVENLLHRMVCKGEISLQQAQYDILYNWTKYATTK